jgi:glycosyltransferase involved in cell wall biosynthesis
LIQVVSGFPAYANAVVGLGKPVALQVATLARVERRLAGARVKGLGGLWRSWMTDIADRADRRALRRVDAIQVENRWMLAEVGRLNRDRPALDLRLAPPGIDVDFFQPRPEGRPIGPPYILCVGRLDDPRKNLDLLLHAFAALPPDLAGVHLMTAGATPPSARFRQEVARLRLTERVQHVSAPEREALRRLYQDATVFALPSDEEGLGLVVLESMACGVPVVATRGGGPEEIISDGSDGFLVPRGASGDLAERLALVCRSPELREAMGGRARATVERRYSEAVTGAAFLGVWDRLLKSRARSDVRC